MYAKSQSTIKFHRDVWMPSQLETACLTMLVRWNGTYTLTKHAAERLVEKRVPLPTRIPFRRCEVIEVTVCRGQVEKFLIRFTPEPGADDVVMALTTEGRVTTVYRNAQDDHHRTLNVRQYMTR